ncbi:peroxidase [Rhizobacter sp. SG703]|uniref:Dyp-type peroxidase n=1 Tax=Rhizobacter sp. SG703 TaxID=2587140 RepID=UPI00144589FB|nr:peroxidase [Rhizobacter sp. SG703]NKI96991.1 Dyp-type peroxidase family [Rhizobacter sp. SG703]
MALPVVDLSKTLSLAATTAAERALLAQLQGNLLKGHGRPHAAHLLLRFGPAQAGRAFLRGLLPQIGRADVQLADAQRVRAARAAGRPLQTPPFVACLLSASGYRALQVPRERWPSDPAFAEGLKDRQPMLRDPDPAGWELPWRGEVHALVQLAGDAPQVEAQLAAWAGALPPGVALLGVERTRAWRNAGGEGIEHFGFVTGRSQPLMIDEDLASDALRRGPSRRWSPRFPLAQVLVRDPAVDDATAHGSYVVCRKLEQNVHAFRQAEAALARGLRKLGAAADAALAGAMLVGRFADGTPLALQGRGGLAPPRADDFDYADDPQGLRCPFHAHIRKTNPRGDTVREFGIAPDAERARLMARRSMPYGERRQDAQMRFSDAPSQGVGLLFMACQASIVEQFEFSQANRANDEGFVLGHTGVDPLAGQGGAVKHRHRAGWGDAQAPTLAQRMAGFVTLKGGEYFFAPSLAFFASL